MASIQIRSLDHRRRIGEEKTAPYLFFDGSNDGLSFGSDASLDDIFGADCTIEAWFRKPTQGIHYFLTKGVVTVGWAIQNAGGATMRAIVSFAGGTKYVSAPAFTVNAWHHLAVVYDASSQQITAYMDGQAGTPQTGSGAYVSDASRALCMNYECVLQRWYGDMGWTRLSSVKRYSGAFAPPSRVAPPAIDGDTIEQWNIDEGSGTTAAAQVSSPTNDGTISGATWMEG